MYRTVPLILLLLVVGACRSPADLPPDLPIGTDLGEHAPQLSGTLATGEPFELGSTDPPHTLLVFYRGAQCGLCRVQLEQLQANLPGYRRKGVRAVAVTLDPPDRSRQLFAGNPIQFDVVSTDSATFRAWDVIEPRTGVPLPATFIIDRDGVVRYRHIGRNASDRALDVEVLTFLESIELP